MTCVFLALLLLAPATPEDVNVWEQVLVLEPNHAETLFELTRAYTRSDRLADAAETGTRLAECPGWEGRAAALLGAIRARPQ